MADIIEEKDKILSFTLFKVEKGREKICKCNPPHLEIDTVNRVVTCTDCGATLDAFDALVTTCEYMKQYEEYQRKAIKQIKVFQKEADKEWNRRMKNKAFKDMELQYRNGLYPYCPECGKLFDPMKINSWANKKFCREDSDDGGQ